MTAIAKSTNVDFGLSALTGSAVAEDPTELQILLRIVEVIDRRMETHTEPSQLPAGGYLANIVNNFIASSPDVMIESGDIDMGDSYTVGQAGAVGPGASAQDMSFSQVWNQSASSVDLAALVGELSRLRAEMSGAAESEPERYHAIAEIASAEKAAAKQDGPAVMKHLRQAGAWALEVARSIGVEVAVTALKSALGI
jgi:hypothetical protein